MISETGLERTKNRLRKYIREIPDYPKPGILFRDIQPLLREPTALGSAVDIMANNWFRQHVEAVVGLDARGFILGAMLASEIHAPFVMIRKKGKLPPPTESLSYKLEYGEGELEVATDMIGKGERVLVVDDLLATGGTVAGACKLVERLGGHVVGCQFLIEMTELGGRKALDEHLVTSILAY